MIPPYEISDEMAERRWYYHSFRQSWGRNASAYGLARSPDNQWFIEIVLPDGTKRRLGRVPDFEAGLRCQDYCAKHDTLVKIALIGMDREGDLDSLTKIFEDGIAFGELPRRRVRLTLEIEATMRGSDDEIKNYVLLHLRGATGVSGATVLSMDGPRIEEPRPIPT